MKTNKPISLSVTHDVSFAEQLEIAAHVIKNYPEIAEIIISQKGKINCPFLSQCNAFPCKTLTCNADICDNGYAYRMS